MFAGPINAPFREKVLVLGAMASAAALALLLGFLYAPGATMECVSLIPLAFVAAGKFLPLWGITGHSQLSPWHLGALNGVLDTCTGVLLIYGLGSLERIGVVSGWLTKVRGHAELVVQAYPWMRRLAVISVALFVLFPVTGTGAIAATFLGILLGLGRFETIGAISLGGFLGGFGMALAVVRFKGLLLWIHGVQSAPAVKYALTASLALLVAAGFFWLNRVYKRVLAVTRAQVALRATPP
jgi:uncharacterized membrane protein